MGSEGSGGESSAPRDEQLIFISDASAEAERLMSALRSRGYAVVEVPLALLVGRVSVQKPALILCDVDAAPALDQVRRLREVPGGGQVDIVFFGQPSRSLDELRDDVFHESSGFFVRPVDTFGLLRKVEALIGPPSEPDPSRRAGTGPSSRPPAALPRSPDSARPPPPPRPEVISSVPPTPPASPGARVASTTPPRAKRPSPVPDSGPSSLPPAHASAPPEPTSSIPSPEPSLPRPIPLGFGADPDGLGSAIGRHVVKSEISAELEGILARAEQRIGGTQGSQRAPASLRMTPEDEVDAVLPADVLSALDEPLGIDEDEDDDGGGTGTGDGSASGGSARTGLLTASGTSGGRTGVGALGPLPAPTAELQGAAGPTAAPPARERSQVEAPFVSLEEPPRTPPALPSSPPEPPSQSPQSLSALSAMTSIEPRSLGTRDLEARTAVARPTPLPPAPTPNGIRLGRITQVEAPLPESARPEPPLAEALEIPQALARGDSAKGLARTIRSRFTGALAFESDAGIRRIVLRDGDFVTAASGIADESLVAFLTERGTLAPDVQKALGHKLPAFGRHAGAALIAHGHLRQDELWPVLRSHAEWLIGRALEMTSGSAGLERDIPARLQAEPAVFGGATGAEVYVEIVRRVVAPEEAEARLGGARARLIDGPGAALLTECALSPEESVWIGRAKTATLGELAGAGAPRDLSAVVYALVELGVLEALSPAQTPPGKPPSAPRAYDALDEQALRARIHARRALVEEGDYFALLGVTKGATTYDVQRAYGDLRREFDPGRILTASTANLREDVDLILEVLDEAYEILSDQLRRERYRRALEATPS